MKKEGRLHRGRAGNRRKVHLRQIIIHVCIKKIVPKSYQRKQTSKEIENIQLPLLFATIQ